MAKKIEFTEEQKKEIQLTFSKIKKSKDMTSYNRILVLNMRCLGKTNKEIREVTEYNTQYITDLVRLYIKKGMSAMIGNHYTSHNRKMSFEEETEFLEQFTSDAEAGLITDVKKILEKFEKATEKKSCKSTIYKLLKRHGWRRVSPRPCNPNGSTEEEKNSSKKLTLCGNESYWKNM